MKQLKLLTRRADSRNGSPDARWQAPVTPSKEKERQTRVGYKLLQIGCVFVEIGFLSRSPGDVSGMNGRFLPRTGLLWVESS